MDYPLMTTISRTNLYEALDKTADEVIFFFFFFQSESSIQNSHFLFRILPLPRSIKKSSSVKSIDLII